MLILGKQPDPQAIETLAQKLVGAIEKAVRGQEYPPQKLIDWLLEAEGAILLYSKAPEEYFRKMPKLSFGAERAIINKSCTDLNAE